MRDTDCPEYDDDYELATMNERRFFFAVLELKDAINYYGLNNFVVDLCRVDKQLAQALAERINYELTTPEYKGVLLATKTTKSR